MPLYVLVIGLGGVQFGLQTELNDTKSYYQLIIKNYNFRENKNSQVMKEKENLHQNTDKRGVNCFMSL